VLNVKVEKINSAEGPAFGAAILASVGAGIYPSVEEACAKLINVTETFTPDAASAQGYDRRYPIFTGLYTALKDSFHQQALIER
jgi:xylulokinase